MLKSLWERFSALRYVFASVAAWVVDNSLYFLFLRFDLFCISALGAVAASTVAQIAARVLSSFFNFNCNHFLVFRSTENYGKALGKYYCLCIPQAAVSVLLLDIGIANLSIPSTVLQTALKIAIETVLFAVSYVIQNRWVFRKNT